MSKKLKFLIWSVGILAALIILAIIGLKLFFPLEDIKAMAIEKGEKALGRELVVETIDLSIWGGLGVKLGGVVVGSPKEFGDLELLNAQAVDIKLQLWELIQGNYVIDRLIVTKPIMQLKKLADGSNNYTFKLDASDVTDPEIAKDLETATPEKQVAATVVAFDNLQIIDATIIYQDDSTGYHSENHNMSLTSKLEMPKTDLYRSSGRLTIDRYTMTSDMNLPDLNIKLSYEVEYDLSSHQLSIKETKFTVNQVELTLDGQIVKQSGHYNGRLQVLSDNLDLSKLILLLPESQKKSFDDLKITGLADVDGSVEWNYTNDSIKFNYVASAILHDAAFSFSQAQGELLISQTVLDLKNNQARLTINDAAFDGRPLKGFLAVEDFEAPIVNAELNGSIDLSFLKPFLPADVDQTITGLAQFDMAISGPVDRPEKINYVGELVIENGSYVSSLLPEPIESFELSVSLAPQAIRLDKFTAQFVSSDISITGRINNPFPYLLPFELENRGQAVQPDAELNVSSHRLDIDKLFPEAVPGSGAIEISGGEVVIDSIPMIPLPDISVVGKISLDTVIYAKVEFTQLEGKLGVANRKIRVYDVTGKVYSGRVTGETTVDLSDIVNPHYDGKFKAEQIEVDGFISRFSKLGGNLSGKANMAGSYNAVGWEPEAFMNSMTMNSVGSIDKAKLISAGAVSQLFSSLSEYTGKSYDENQTLEKLWTNIRVENGRVYLDDFKTVLGNIGDVTLNGSYGFDETIKYAGSILLTEEMTAELASKGGLVGGLVNLMTSKENKRFAVPIAITGTANKPNFNLDFNALQPDAKDNLEDKAKSLLKGLFK